jgi:pyruvate, water dikinase
VLRLVAPLNLVDPLRDDFTPEGCRTLHDVLRFVHEKAVTRLIACADFGARSRRAVALELSVPAGIAVIDIGGGLERLEGTGRAGLEQIASVPFRAIARGLTTPGVWRSEAVPISTGDFLSSMFRAPDVLAHGAFAERNVAVISRAYANIHIRFGYHYTILDCYCSDTPRDNHVDFRFAGGATDITRRSLRLQLLSTVLEKHGFNARVRGDLLAARLANVGRDEMIPILEEVGKLIAFSRQLDAVLRNEEDVQRFARSFLQGTYDVQ